MICYKKWAIRGLLFLSSNVAYGGKELEKITVIKGYIARVLAAKVCYPYTDSHVCWPQGKGTRICLSKDSKTESPWLEVVVYSEPKNIWLNWFCKGHPQLGSDFPPSLPLSLFLDQEGNIKKEGETISFLYKKNNNNDNKEFFKIILTLYQTGYIYRRLDSFEKSILQDDDCKKYIERKKSEILQIKEIKERKVRASILNNVEFKDCCLKFN